MWMAAFIVGLIVGYLLYHTIGYFRYSIKYDNDLKYTIGLEKSLRKILNKVNKVTAPHRHGNKIPKSALDELSNTQIEVENEEDE